MHTRFFLRDIKDSFLPIVWILIKKIWGKKYFKNTKKVEKINFEENRLKLY